MPREPYPDRPDLDQPEILRGSSRGPGGPQRRTLWDVILEEQQHRRRVEEVNRQDRGEEEK